MKKKIAGMNLVELTIVAAIITILAALTLPSFRSAQQDAKAEQWAMELQDSIKFARMASYRSFGTKLCGTNNPPDNSCQASFVNGWTVQISDSTGAYSVLQANPRVIGATDITGTAANVSLFNTGGVPAYAGTLTWTIKPAKCNSGMQVSVDSRGNISSTQVTCP